MLIAEPMVKRGQLFLYFTALHHDAKPSPEDPGVPSWLVHLNFFMVPPE